MPDPPPKPKKKGPDDLAEVERALSVLQGRHPEHERARREDQESRKRRAAELDTHANRENRRVYVQRARIAAVVVPVVLLFAFIGVFGRREMARRARIDAVSESFRVHGFTAIETSLRGSTETIDVTAEPGCFLAVSTDTKPVSITRPGGVVAAVPPALFCSCASERIAVTSPVGPHGGIALLRAEAALVGGSRAFAYAPFKPASALVTDELCSEISLDAWIEARRYPHPTVDDGWLTSNPQRAPLAAAGFHVLTTSRSDVPFVVVEAPKESCVIATGAAGDPLVLRTKGDSAPVAEGKTTIGRCAQAETTLIVSREGASELTVLVAPAAKVGGLLGLRELTAGTGLELGASTVPPSDRGWDAKQLLVASAIPEATVTIASAPDVPLDLDARIVALSLDAQDALKAELAPEVESSCLPALEPKTRESLCVFSGAQKWRGRGGPDAPAGGLARAKLPFWLYTMNGVKDPGPLEGLSKLLSLARTLGRDGFVPTTLEALVEQPYGVEVLGRTGEDAIVGVGVGPSEPWVYPLTATDAWTLDEPPQIALVQPLEKVILTTTVKKLPPLATRRTVVFRRQKR